MAEAINIKTHVIHEVRRLFRFVFVGASSFLIHFGIYYLISRYLWATGNRLFIQIISVGFTILYNFLAHRRWTYQSNGRLRSELLRFTFVVLAASGIQTGVFWIAIHLLGFYDLWSLVLASGISAVFTFITHRLFTFRHPSETILDVPDVI